MSAVRDMAATPTFRGLFPTRPAEVMPPSRRERFVFALLCATIVLSVWLVGAWEVWAQIITFGLSMVAFSALFFPMFDFRGWPPSATARQVWSRLKTFPIFWVGLAVMAYGVIAALNPSRVLIVSEQRMWLENVPNIEFLPHSLITPFSPMNAWHALMIIVPAWLAVCAAWVGLETEQSWRRLLGIVAVNGAVLALVGMAQALSKTRLMFGLLDLEPDIRNPGYFGSFIWAGHAAAWLTLAFGAVAAITDHHLRRRDPQAPPRSRGWPAPRTWVWLGSQILIVLVLGLFLKPDFWLLGVGGVLLVGVWVWLARLWREGQKRRATLYALPALIFMGVLLFSAGSLILIWRQGHQANKYEVNPNDPGLALRYAFAKTSATMIKDEPWLGWGPGSFRYVSPHYLPKNPIFNDPEQPGVALYGLHYAYNDLVQYVAEWGLCGVALFAAGMAWWVYKAWRMRAVLPGESWIVLGAVAMVIVESGLDCPFFNPAVLIAAAILPATAIKFGEFSTRPQPTLSKVVVACP